MSINYGSKIVSTGLMVYVDAANPKCYPGTGLTFNNLAKGYENTSISLYGDTANYGRVIDDVIELGGASGNNSSGTMLRGLYDLTSTVNTSFTSSAWMYFTGTYGEIMSYRESSRRLSTYVTESGIYFNQRRNVDPFDTQSTGVSVSNPLNQWAHYCVTKNGSTFKFYKNGELVGTTSFSMLETVSSGGAFHVGIAWSDDDYLSRVMDGRVGPVMHYNRDLEAFEVKQNFEAAKGRFGL